MNANSTNPTSAQNSVPASESQYLAALIQNKIESGALFLDPDEFSELRHEIIYSACAKRLLDGAPIDAALVISDLSAVQNLDIAGGAAFIESLAARSGASCAHFEEHARLIRRASTARALAEETAQLATTAPDSLEQTLAQLQNRADELRARLRVSRRVELTDAQTLRARFGAQKWMWWGYVPVGHVTCILAQQGQGKSNVALDLCHRLAGALPMPDGQSADIRFGENDRIFYLDAEGFLQGILARLEAWGTPDENFIWPLGCEEKQWQLNTSGGWAEFESIVAQFRPKIVVVDSLSGANTLEERDNDQMKSLMQNFVALAKRFGICVILIHHLRKASVGEPQWPVNLDRSRGASAITQFCRVVHAIGTPDATTPTLRRFETIKNNLGAFAPALGFEVFEEGVTWGEAPEIAAKNERPRGEARQFLEQAFAGAEYRLIEELVSEAGAQGISQRTLYRARDEMALKTTREQGRNGRSFWSLSKPLEK